MLVLFFAGFLAAVTAGIAALIWLMLRLSGRRRRGRMVFRRALVVYLSALPLLLFVGAPLLLSSLIANASTRPQDRGLTDTPKAWGRDYEDVRLISRDGIQIRGWRLPGDPSLPVLILGHGLFRSRQEVLERACLLNKEGFPALLIDFRNHGVSGVRHVSLGYQERLDILGAYDWLKREGLPAGVVVVGVSMGAVAGLHAAPEMAGDLKAVIADSPFRDLEETVTRHVDLILGLPQFPFADLFIWNLTRICGFDKSELDVKHPLARLQAVPILLIYGEDDERMPKSTALGVLEEIPGSRKEIVFFPNAQHGAAFRSDPTKYVETVTNFLSQSGER